MNSSNDSYTQFVSNFIAITFDNYRFFFLLFKSQVHTLPAFCDMTNFLYKIVSAFYDFRNSAFKFPILTVVKRPVTGCKKCRLFVENFGKSMRNYMKVIEEILR